VTSPLSSAPEYRAARLLAPPLVGARHPSAFEPPGRILRPPLPKSTRPPRPPRSLAPSSRRTPVGRRTPNGPPVRSMPPPAVLSPLGRRWLLDVAVGLLGRWQEHLPPIKRSQPLLSRPSHGRAATGAITGHRGELEAWPAIHRTKPFPTFPCIYQSSPEYPFSHRAATSPAGRSQRPPRLAAGAPTPPILPRPNRAQESVP
jgi:hypothetical protein